MNYYDRGILGKLEAWSTFGTYMVGKEGLKENFFFFFFLTKGKEIESGLQTLVGAHCPSKDNIKKNKQSNN